MTVAALSAVFDWADRTAKIPAGFNPACHGERFVERGTRRALTGDELPALGAALREAEEEKTLHPSALLVVRLLALTASVAPRSWGTR